MWNNAENRKKGEEKEYLPATSRLPHTLTLKFFFPSEEKIVLESETRGVKEIFEAALEAKEFQY